MFPVRLYIGEPQLGLEEQKVMSIPAGIMTTGHSKPFAAWHVVMVTFWKFKGMGAREGTRKNPYVLAVLTVLTVPF